MCKPKQPNPTQATQPTHQAQSNPPIATKPGLIQHSPAQCNPIQPNQTNFTQTYPTQANPIQSNTRQGVIKTEKRRQYRGRKQGQYLGERAQERWQYRVWRQRKSQTWGKIKWGSTTIQKADEEVEPHTGGQKGNGTVTMQRAEAAAMPSKGGGKRGTLTISMTEADAVPGTMGSKRGRSGDKTESARRVYTTVFRSINQRIK